MSEIKNFDTGIPIESGIKIINLDPKENILNKKKIRNILKKISESNLDDLSHNIKNAYHENAEIYAFHPVNELKGVDEIKMINDFGIKCKKGGKLEYVFNKVLNIEEINISDQNIVNGIKVIGVNNLMNRLPLTASNLYAKNLFSFIRNLFSKEKKDFNINIEDEIIKKTLIKEVI